MLVEKVYQRGVPMGGVLEANQAQQSPKFVVWATKDPIHANLDRIQLIKGWQKDGVEHEAVFDVACSGGRVPDERTGRCPGNGDAKTSDDDPGVDLQSCEISNEVGNAELKVLWEDEDFDPLIPAFYYFRVLQVPTCRWSSYDAIRLGQDPIEEVSATIQERAWSSSIWYSPGG